MEGYGPATYGDRMAPSYDSWVAQRLGPPPEAQLKLLAELAGSGPALELGIGTGRVALPLLARGVEVHGLDASEAMVARMREKPGGDSIPVTIGDMKDVGVSGRYALVFVVFDTFFGGLHTQEHQLGCFRNVAARLLPGGRFLIEAFVPDMTRFDRGQRTETLEVGLDEAVIHLSRHDPVAQLVESANLTLSSEGIGVMPVVIRYAWPSELDLMARLAGLELESRWGDWDRSSFTASSQKHVSVYSAG